MKRVDKINYYLDIAQTVAARGTCLRRNFGAIIVKNDEIISTGYVGAPRGRQNCCDLGSVSYTHLLWQFMETGISMIVWLRWKICSQKKVFW